MSLGRVYFFTPLPPINSGIAKYSHELINYFSEICEVTVVVDQKQYDIPGHADVVQLSDWLMSHDKNIPVLYQVGNSNHHRYIYSQALKVSGIVDLHDFNLHQYLQSESMTNSAIYKTALEKCHGKKLGRKIFNHSKNGILSPTSMFLSPLNCLVLRKASAVIVHSEWAYRRVKAQYPDKAVIKTPLHFMPYIDDISSDVARKKLGLPADSFIMSALGHITPAKQIDLVIKTISLISKSMPKLKLVIAGECSREEELQKLIDSVDVRSNILRLEDVNDEDFDLIIAASDLIINLRFPSVGENSATLVRGMGMGRACVVYDYATFAEYPNETVFKIPLNIRNPELLSEKLCEIITDRPKLHLIGANAQKYIRTNNSIVSAARIYEEIIHSEFS